MKTARIELDGENYLICCPIGVLERIDEYMKNEATGNDFTDSLQLLYFMIEAGAKYAEKKGWDNPRLPLVDELKSVCDLSDFERIRAEVASAISNANQTEVMIAGEKEQEATLGR